MGYRGKLEEQMLARDLRATGMTLDDIAHDLGVSKSSVSLWVRDVPFERRSRRASVDRRPHPQHLAKLAEIDECNRWAAERIGTMSDPAFLAAGTALYAGEGSKRDGRVTFANTDPAMMALFCAWLRKFFSIDESRLRVRVYLHEGLTSTPRKRSGQRSRAYRAASSTARTERRPIPRSVRQSIRTAADMSITTVRGPIERSWASCGRC